MVLDIIENPDVAQALRHQNLQYLKGNYDVRRESIFSHDDHTDLLPSYSSHSSKSKRCIPLANSNTLTGTTPAPPTICTISMSYLPTTTSTTRPTGANSPRTSSPADGKSLSRNSTLSEKPSTHGLPPPSSPRHPPTPTTSQNLPSPNFTPERGLSTGRSLSISTTQREGPPPRDVPLPELPQHHPNFLPMGTMIPHRRCHLIA